MISESDVQAFAGIQSVSFEGLPSGVFLCTAEAPGWTRNLRMVVIEQRGSRRSGAPFNPMIAIVSRTHLS